MNKVIPENNEAEILDQSLWFDHYIKQANKLWCIPEAWKVGMVAIRDVCNIPESRFLTFEGITGKYSNCITQFTYTRLVVAIPRI